MILFGGDCKSAFMQGGADPLADGEEALHLSQPRNGRLPGLRPKQLVRMVGSGYGKINAPRLWWRVLIGFLISIGWQRHSMDQCIMLRYDDRNDYKLVAVLGVHVDDLIGGTVGEKWLQPIWDRFAFGSFVWREIDFCGREIR